MGKIFGFIAGAFCILVMIMLLIGVGTHPDKDRENPSADIEVKSWKDVLIENGFSNEEVEKYSDILSKVGISDIGDIDVIENGIMHIIRCKVLNNKDLQLNVTLENREIIYISFTGFPEYTTTAYINWLGNLKLKGEIVKGQVDLYSDTEGGYLAKVDWKNKQITDMDGNLITKIE